MKLPNKVLVFDVESYGLHGKAFAFGMLVLDTETGEISDQYAYHIIGWDESPAGPVSPDDLQWLKDNISISFQSCGVNDTDDLRDIFWTRYLELKNKYPYMGVAVECGWPVEARFLNKCIDDNMPKSKWDGPYPLHEIASFMLAAGMDPMKTYERTGLDHPAHDPLADSYLSARLLMEAYKALQ